MLKYGIPNEHIIVVAVFPFPSTVLYVFMRATPSIYVAYNRINWNLAQYLSIITMSVK